MPEVSLSGMKNDIKVNLQPIGENVYRATYIPTQPGAYLLNVMWSDRLVNSAFIIIVSEQNYCAYSRSSTLPGQGASIIAHQPSKLEVLSSSSGLGLIISFTNKN